MGRAWRLPGSEAKIAAIGVRRAALGQRFTGSINVAPDLSHYSGIVPCGIDAAHLGVTSLKDLGVQVRMSDVDAVLAREFEAIFGPAQRI